jgi:hypothetical protein
MSDYDLSWTVGIRPHCRGGNKDAAESDDVARILNEIRDHSGSMGLERLNGPEIGPQSLSVETEGRYSVLMLRDTREDYIVRTLTNTDHDSGFIEIIGDLWDARTVTSNFDLVVQVFKEFFETGDVSREILS